MKELPVENTHRTEEVCIKTTRSHAFKQPSTSILSLILVTGMTMVTGLFAQESSSPAKHSTPLPITRIITSNDGRYTAGTVLAIYEGGITFKRNDTGMKFEISLSKLSEADQQFFRSWEPVPSYRESSVSVAGSPSLNRSNYTSRHQPGVRTSSGGGGGRWVSTGGRWVCGSGGRSSSTTTYRPPPPRPPCR